MKLVISNIVWDNDYPWDPKLPETVVIEDPEPQLLEDMDSNMDNIAEYLAEEYGYCVFGFNAELEEDNND